MAVGKDEDSVEGWASIWRRTAPARVGEVLREAARRGEIPFCLAGLIRSTAEVLAGSADSGE